MWYCTSIWHFPWMALLILMMFNYLLQQKSPSKNTQTQSAHYFLLYFLIQPSVYLTIVLNQMAALLNNQQPTVSRISFTTLFQDKSEKSARMLIFPTMRRTNTLFLVCRKMVFLASKVPSCWWQKNSIYRSSPSIVTSEN